MNRIYLLAILTLLLVRVSAQNCTCNYSFVGSNDTMVFTNLSSVSNAHYYWNFGDGSTSFETDPVHIFPESGNYLVTLFGRDTISNCHTYYETWIGIDKYTTEPCKPEVTDSFIQSQGEDFLKVIDSSVNCSAYIADYDCGLVGNSSIYMWIPFTTEPPLSSAYCVLRGQYYNLDTNGYLIIHREYYTTVPYKYSSNLNYDECSANFEYSVDPQVNGAVVNLTAMNQHAISYDFIVTGLGNPIHFYTPTATCTFPYQIDERYFPWFIGLYTEDPDGCRDTVWQQLFIRNPNYIQTGIEQVHLNRISISPNPATISIQLQLPSNHSTTLTLTLFNLLGEKVKEQTITGSNITIDVSELPAGVYVVRAGEWSGKFVKE